MYEERKEKFSFKSFFLTLLLVLLFIFLMLWLFPTRNYIDSKLNGTHDLERISVLYDEIFANNVSRMKEAAIGYFTNERMPKEVGKSKKLTLKQMYDLHLVLKMKDKNGKACSTTKSYVEMTKYTEEYRLKVNLSCGDYEDYIIVYLGCYSYCPGGICEKQVSTPSKKTAIEEKKYSGGKVTQTNNDNKPSDNKPGDNTPGEDKPSDNPEDKPGDKPEDPTPDKPTPGSVTYMYEYKLEIKPELVCGGWTEWQKQYIKETNSTKVETKTVNEITSYKTVKVKVGETTKTVVTGTKTEKYISGYTTELVVTGTKTIQVGTTTREITEKVKVGTVEVYAGVGSGPSVPSNTATTVYKNVVASKVESCSYCTNKTMYSWDVYKVEPVYNVITRTETVPVERTINVYEKQEVPVWSYRTVDVTEQVTTPIYKETKTPVYSNVTYYRSKTCSMSEGKYDIKWSYSKYDADLIRKGYKLTGRVKKV